MAVFFPSLDALRLALTSGAVPAPVCMAPVAAAFEAEGEGEGVWVNPSVEFPKKAIVALRRLGAEFHKDKEPAYLKEYTCWLQLLALECHDPTLGLTDRAPVLFELRPATLLPEVCGEILRLGNDRQSFRWLGEGEGEGENTTVFLRVLGPPYYTLLRAFERDGWGQAPRAYLERAAGVWVELGYNHLLVQQVKPAPGQWLLLRPPRDWTAIAEAPFHDIYEILEFQLPAQPLRWRDVETPRRLTVPLALVPANTAEPAELWVLRDRGFEQINELVRTSDDALLGRLAFAATEGSETLVLRVRPSPSRQEPPVLVLLGQSFRPYLKLPNLFLPCGTRLQPPLRRDAVRKRLADDPDQVTWLYPTADGGFMPESLPDSSFRPLSDWVDYVVHHERVALQQWIEATTFDFEPFVCKDEEREAARAKKKEPHDKRPRPDDATPLATPSPAVVRKAVKLRAPDAGLPALPAVLPSELQKRLRELEQQFLSLEGPIDAAERTALWPELAMVNAALGQASDAALCWMQALWPEPGHAASWAQAWSHGEKPSDPGRLHATAEPTASDVRSVAAWLTAQGHSREPATVPPLAQVQRYLEKHEDLLPVRAVWLSATAAFRLSHGDVLGLTRTRDRLLERLFQRGLTHDQDLPSFLRFSGISHSDRLRAFRDWLLALPERLAEWVQRDHTVSDPDPRDTIAYGRLMLAFGLARLGEEHAAKRLVELAEGWLTEVVVEHKDVHLVLKDAFRYRIQQALAGKPAVGPLPAEILEFAEQLGFVPRYIVDSLRTRSRILEPHEKIKAYRHSYMGPMTDLDKALNALPDILDRAALEKECQRVLGAAKNPTQRFHAVKGVLAVTPRLGSAVAEPLLREVPAVSDDPIDVRDQAELLERALFLAAHFNQVDTIPALLARFQQLLRVPKLGTDRNKLDLLISQCFRGLRKLGMQDEMRGLLDGLAAVLTHGKPLSGLRKADDWPKLVRRLLHVAAGHFYFGDEAEGRQLLEEARLVLLSGDLQGREQTELACTYVSTLGQAPLRLALPAIDELLQRLRGVFDNFVSHTHYSASKLEVLEALVLTVVTEEFAMGQVSRRWLEDDEYLVRKRIHRDVAEALGKH
jgi:hypothetical protein